MRNYIFSILIALLTLPVFGQQQMQAKAVLDKTAAAFEKAGGVKATFRVQASSQGRSLGTSGGTIQLKGDKFLLRTPEVITWFDGETQWSYLVESEEVNISLPTPEELQGMNPYALLYLYRNGFASQMGTSQTYQGKQTYEIILTTTDKKEPLSRIVLYVTKDSYQPVGIVAETRNKNRSEITVTGYQAGQKYADSMFAFEKKQYPRAAVIDLR